MQISQFQQLIRDKYYATDKARGAPGTYLWFVEEVGELAHAIANRERGKLDQANLEEEFADVLAWLATLATYRSRYIRAERFQPMVWFFPWKRAQAPQISIKGIDTRLS
jgi:NTP pyrophosphatase (non-canonical NTP hydrolase)